MRDLVAISTLPAVWAGLSVAEIGRSLADILLNTLSLDLIYLRLAAPISTGDPIEFVCDPGAWSQAGKAEASRR